MVLANVCAAETLIERRTPLLFRVHEEPDPTKLDALREMAEASGLTLAKGQVLKTAHLNRLLAQADGTDEAELINMATLRAMTQAYYNPENFGHFGLALAQLRAFHLADPPLFRPDRPPRADQRAWLGRGRSEPDRHRHAGGDGQVDLRERAAVDGGRARHGGPVSRRLSRRPGRDRHRRPDQRRSAAPGFSSSWTGPAPTRWCRWRRSARNTGISTATRRP